MEQHPPDTPKSEPRVAFYEVLHGEELHSRRETCDLVPQSVNLAPGILQAVLKSRDQLQEISSDAGSAEEI
jgi:hypothetical protein